MFCWFKYHVIEGCSAIKWSLVGRMHLHTRFVAIILGFLCCTGVLFNDKTSGHSLQNVMVHCLQAAISNMFFY